MKNGKYRVVGMEVSYYVPESTRCPIWIEDIALSHFKELIVIFFSYIKMKEKLPNTKIKVTIAL